MRGAFRALVSTTLVLGAPAAQASTYTQPLHQKRAALTQLGWAAGSVHIPGGSVPATSGAGGPAPILALAAFAGLFRLAGAVGGAVRLLGWYPPWAVAWRHSWREAEYRAGGGWLALLDRLGRRTPSPPQGPNRSS